MVGTAMSLLLLDSCHGVDWHDAAELMRRAPLADREPDMIRRCFENSDLVCFAMQDGKLVGMARMLSDHTCQAVLYDLCVHPDLQGSGIGGSILKRMLSRCDAPNVVLWAVPGKEPFYLRYGFRPMKTAMANFADPDSQREKGYIS